MADKPMPPWRKSIRSNASSGCVEVTWINGVLADSAGSGSPSAK